MEERCCGLSVSAVHSIITTLNAKVFKYAKPQNYDDYILFGTSRNVPHEVNRRNARSSETSQR